jgi:hypothetical protein
MSYEIEKHADFLEVRVFGHTSKLEILRILWELRSQCPRKDMPDVWHIARESQVPFVHFAEIAAAVMKLLPPRTFGCKSAIVAPDAFSEAQIAMYCSEASFLPFPTRVFRSREDAIQWLLEPVAQPATTVT